MTKFFINLSSFSWVITLYLIHNEIFILCYAPMDRYISIFIYIMLSIFLSLYALLRLNKLKLDTSHSLEIKKIYPIYNEYMPIYLAICVIAFELNNFTDIDNGYTVFIISIIIFILFYISNIGYLNPIWYLMNKRIYKIENDESNYIILMDKIENTKQSNALLESTYKLDEYTLIKFKE